MSRYYKKTKPKRKSNLNKKAKNIVASILAVFALFGVISAVFTFLNFSWLEKSSGTERDYVNVNLVPGDSWSSDGSSYGAWCWNDSGVPAAAFVLATDEDKDGVYTVRVSSEYKYMLFVDLVPGATELGASWQNKREQTNNLNVPSDENVYYHAYASAWSENADILFAVTIEEMSLYLDCVNWTCTVKPVVYYFDKTGKAEPGFFQMIQCGSSQYIATIPAGYTHVIFIEYSDVTSVGTWDNIIVQTEDLVIPSGTANHFNTENHQWFEPSLE